MIAFTHVDFQAIMQKALLSALKATVFLYFPIYSYIFLYILYPSDYSLTYITSSPMRVAEVLPVIRTRTVSPMW